VVQGVPPPARTRFATPARATIQAAARRPLQGEALARVASTDAYVNNVFGFMNMAPLFAAGQTGAGVKVAVIDTGLTPAFAIADSIVGGENLTGDGVPFLDEQNEGHGTFVSCMITANAIFGFFPDDFFAQAVATHCPECTFEEDGFAWIPMIGSAPDSLVYGVKVFAVDGFTTESIIIAGMESVLLKKLAYLQGMPEVQNPDGSYDSLNIQVANMSLGGLTLFAGRDLEDQLTRVFSELGIVLTKSAGNAGPSGSTGGSPGTGNGGLTVGAASVAANERIFWDTFFGPPFGELFRANTLLQTAYFSSRGPTADGRIDPDLISSGDFNYGMYGLDITLASGTSFSSPAVGGVAATLLGMIPDATAEEVQGALEQGANPDLVEDGSRRLDQGSGYVDGTTAAVLLLSGDVDVEHERQRARGKVRQNIERLVQVVGGKKVTRRAHDLSPGERYELYYEIKPNTDKVTLTLHDVVPGPVQNELFGDDILFSVHSAKTHVAGQGDYYIYAFTSGGSATIPNPEPGLMRVTLNGDWTNASHIDASVTVESTQVRPAWPSSACSSAGRATGAVTRRATSTSTPSTPTTSSSSTAPP
jgi:hypothetical protein